LKEKTKVETVDDYIAKQPKKVQVLLRQMRTAVRSAAPQATEVISYGMPAFRQRGILAYFAAFKNHIGFYPTLSAVKAFEKDLSRFETSKGTVRFPLDQPLPLALVKRIVKFRVKEQSSPRP